MYHFTLSASVINE